jgi:hypothetical protein
VPMEEEQEEEEEEEKKKKKKKKKNGIELNWIYSYWEINEALLSNRPL